jgi:hypothetical protein
MSRFNEIKERRKKATPGPWKYIGLVGDPGKDLRHCVEGEKGKFVSLSEGFYADYAGLEKDQIFIAHAPQDIDWLIKRVEELEAELKRSEARCKALIRHNTIAGEKRIRGMLK